MFILSVPVFMLILFLIRLFAGHLEHIGFPTLPPLLLLQLLFLVAFLSTCVGAGPWRNADAILAVIAGMFGVAAMAVQELATYSGRGSRSFTELDRALLAMARGRQQINLRRCHQVSYDRRETMTQTYLQNPVGRELAVWLFAGGLGVCAQYLHHPDDVASAGAGQSPDADLPSVTVADSSGNF